MAIVHHSWRRWEIATGGLPSLAWNGSPSSDVTSYRVYYGGASRDYTNNTTVGRQSSGQWFWSA